MEALNATTIRSLFDNEPSKPIIPNLEYVDWGVLDYFGWIHPSGHLGYLVTPLGNEEELRGIKLRRALSSNRIKRYEMCSWCNHVHKSAGTAMFSIVVRGSDERRTIGTQLCKNLDCSLRIRNLTSDPPSYMNETMHVNNKVYRLQNALYRMMYRANCLYET